MTLAQLYRAAVMPGPESSRLLPDAEIAPALRKLAEARRQGKLSTGIVDAECLATEFLPGGKINRIGLLGKYGSPHYYVAYEAALRLAQLFPEQLSQFQASGAVYVLATLIDSFWFPAAVREAALDTLVAVGNANAYEGLERALGWLDHENPFPDHDHWRRELVVALVRLNFFEAEHYLWDDVRQFSAEEAALTWEKLLSQHDTVSALAQGVPGHLIPMDAERALEVARRMGPPAAAFKEALERELWRMK